MKLETWLLCHVHAYNYFGGVTRLLISDNLKTDVKSNTRYETVYNQFNKDSKIWVYFKKFHALVWSEPTATVVAPV